VWITQPSKSPEGSQGRSGGSIGCCLVTRVRLPPRCRAGGNDRGRRFPACPQGRLHVAPPRLTVKGGALVMSSERQRPGGSKRSRGALDGESGATNPCRPLDVSFQRVCGCSGEEATRSCHGGRYLVPKGLDGWISVFEEILSGRRRWYRTKTLGYKTGLWTLKTDVARYFALRHKARGQAECGDA
jgi:hypothetical protein